MKLMQKGTYVPGMCKTCKETTKPFIVFLPCIAKGQCLGDECCGWFWGPGSSTCGQPASWTYKKATMTSPYTSQSVSDSLALKLDIYFARLSIGQPETWKCDQRTKDLFCLYAWIMDELTSLSCSDEDRRAMQWYFNRKSRAEDDLFALTAKVMNKFLAGDIDKYRGK